MDNSHYLILLEKNITNPPDSISKFINSFLVRVIITQFYFWPSIFFFFKLVKKSRQLIFIYILSCHFCCFFLLIYLILVLNFGLIIKKPRLNQDKTINFYLNCVALELTIKHNDFNISLSLFNIHFLLLHILNWFFYMFPFFCWQVIFIKKLFIDFYNRFCPIYIWFFCKILHWNLRPSFFCFIILSCLF